MQLVETRLCPMGNRKFVPHPVGADAHIGPAECTVFTGIYGEFVLSQWADRVVGPYNNPSHSL